MMIPLLGYKSKPRLAEVVNCSSSMNVPANIFRPHEYMMIYDDHVEFRSDSYKCPVKNDSHVFELETGDVVSIDSLGRAYVVFSISENDAVFYLTLAVNYKFDNSIIKP